mgnify:CR=1 FL=1
MPHLRLIDVEDATGALREEYDAAFAATQVLVGLPSLEEALGRARSFIDACVQRSGDLLPEHLVAQQAPDGEHLATYRGAAANGGGS